MKTTAEMIEVMRAYLRGEGLEIKAKPNGLWTPLREAESPNWDWRTCDYRIVPKPLECWAVIEAGKVTSTYTEPSRANIHAAGYLGLRVIKMREVIE